MKLYYKAGACSLASHIALTASGLPFHLDAVDLKSKMTESGADFLTINPKGYVPALELDDGSLLTEGVAILLHVAAQAPDRGLAPPAGSREYLRLVEWLVFIATELHKPAGSLFNPAYGDESKAVTTGLLRRRLDYADTTLGHAPYLMGNVCGVADFYLFTVLSWLPRLGFDLGDWPHLAAHLARTGALAAVQTAMKAEMLL